MPKSLSTSVNENANSALSPKTGFVIPRVMDDRASWVPCAIFSMQVTIAINIANAVQAEFFAEEQERIAQVPTVSPAAFDLWEYWGVWSRATGTKKPAGLLSFAVHATGARAHVI